MAEHSRSHAQEIHHFLGIGNVCRACKSFVSSCYTDKNNLSPRKSEIEGKSSKSNEKEDIKNFTSEEEAMHEPRLKPLGSKKSFFKHKSSNKHLKSSPTSSSPESASSNSPGLSPSDCQRPSPSLSRSASRSQTPLSRSLSRTMSQRNSVDGGAASLSRSASRGQFGASTPSLSRTMSQRNSVDARPGAIASLSRLATSRKGTNPIMYSNSSGLIKPASIEKQLECTLEELCFGCVKKIEIVRDVITDDGQIVEEEEEVLTVKVKPGWTKGTRITFEGMGNETLSTYPADVIFIITEKEHPLFIREGDDLHLTIEIPLVKALTGCNVLVPLLGGHEMNLTIDDIIHPGYEEVIQGQGMAMQKESEKRGDLLVKFLVKFPEELTDQQRSEVVNILNMDDC